MAKAKRTDELVPCYDRFEGAKELDGVVSLRASSGGVAREGRMLKRCVMPMVAALLTLLVQLGWMPVFARYHGMRRTDEGNIEFDISDPVTGIRICAPVTEDVARCGQRDLNDPGILPPNNIAEFKRRA